MLSIITPCYNTDKKMFERLAESISQQTNSEFEWIIIDDCSDIVHQKEIDCVISRLKDVRCIVSRNTSNLGAGESRNRGIELAGKDYIVFVDSDDYIDDCFVEAIVERLSNDKVDVLFFDYIRVANNKKKVCKTLNIPDSACRTKKDVALAMSTNVCGKVIRRSLVNECNIRFPELKRYEDWVFMMKAVNALNSWGYINNKPLYYYCDNSTSAVHINADNGYYFARIAFDEIDRIISDKSLLETLYIREVIYTFIRDNILKLDNRQFEEQIKSVLYKYPNWSKNEEIYDFDIAKRTIIYLYRKKWFFIIRLLFYFMK